MATQSRPASSLLDSIALSRARPLHTPPRVIVAEDDDEMRLIVVDALRKDGYDVCEAPDGTHLIAHITAECLHREAAVDLIISDIRMPGCSGLRILECLRQARWTAPMILMTAFGDDETRAEAAQLGAILFDKPFAIDDLRTAVLNLLPV
jgi:DNA-binding response OmpR family regulator